MAERDFFLATAALEAERMEDAVAYLKQWATACSAVSLPEVKLTGKILRSSMSLLRKNWLALNGVKDGKRGELAGLYRTKIEKEMESRGSELAGVMENEMVGKGTEVETKAYVWKLVGDAWRYVAEVSTEETHSKAAESSLDAYLKASALAVDLPACNTVRLAVAINFSVFYYDVLSSPIRAFKLSRSAYDSAIQALATLPDSQRSDVEEAISVLTENLNFWATAPTLSLQN